MSDVYNPFEVEKHISLSLKYTCLIRPAQSGKTRTMQELMLEYERMSKLFYPEDENILNIVICSKNLNLVRQTEARMQEIVATPTESDNDTASDTASESEEADAKIVGGIFSWMTGTKDNNISPKELFTNVVLGDVRMVICCAHKRRLQYLADLLDLFDKADRKRAAVLPRVNIWMDEADAYVNIWSQNDFAKYRKVNEVYLVSATIDTIIEKHERVKVKPYPETFPAEHYHKTQDSIIVEADVETKDPVEYLKAVYNQHKETLKVPGMRMFAPGNDLVASHDAIATFLVENGWAVAVINGRRKVILVPGMEEPLDITKQVPNGTAQEIGKTIAKMYRDYNLAEFSFAITGKLCLSRGITFQCEVRTDEGEIDYDFLFDAGIIPPITRRDELYQCLSRTNGNIRKFMNYAPPTLYMTAATRSSVMDAEKIAINLAILVHRYNLESVGVEEMDFAIHEDYQQYQEDLARPRRGGGGTARTVRTRVYQTEVVARASLSVLCPSYSWRKRNKSGDFYVAAVGGPSKVNAYSDVMRTVANLTGGKGETATQTKYVPCYTDVTDASTLRYVVIVPDTTSEQELEDLDTQFPPLA